MAFEMNYENVKEVGSLAVGSAKRYGVEKMYISSKQSLPGNKITLASSPASIPVKFYEDEYFDEFVNALNEGRNIYKANIAAAVAKKREENALEIANLEADIKANEGTIERIKDTFKDIEMPTKWQNAVKKAEDDIASLKAKIDKLLA